MRKMLHADVWTILLDEGEHFSNKDFADIPKSARSILVTADVTRLHETRLVNVFWHYRADEHRYVGKLRLDPAPSVSIAEATIVRVDVQPKTILFIANVEDRGIVTWQRMDDFIARDGERVYSPMCELPPLEGQKGTVERLCRVYFDDGVLKSPVNVSFRELILGAKPAAPPKDEP